MKLAELAGRMAQKSSLTASQAEAAVDALRETIAEELKKNARFYLYGFGTFHVEQRKARRGRNPKTGAAIDIPAKRVVRWSPSKVLERAADLAAPAGPKRPGMKQTGAPKVVPQIMSREAAAAVLDKPTAPAAPPVPVPGVADEERLIRRARSIAKVSVDDMFLYYGDTLKDAVKAGRDPAEAVAEQLDQARKTLLNRIGEAIAGKEDYVGQAFKAKLATFKPN